MHAKGDTYNRNVRWIYSSPMRTILFYLLIAGIFNLPSLISGAPSPRHLIASVIFISIIGLIAYYWARPQRIKKGNNTTIYDPLSNTYTADNK